MLALLTGCAGSSPRMEPLSVTLSDIQPGQMGLLEQEYLIKIRVQNPNNVEIPVTGLSYRIELNGKSFAKGVSKQDVTVPAFGEVLLDATAVGGLSGIITQIAQFQKGVPDKVSYRLSGKLASTSLSYPFDVVDNIEAGRAALLAWRDGKPHDEKALAALKSDLVRFEAMSMKGQPFLIPTDDPVKSPDAWRGTSDALMAAASGGRLHPAVLTYAQMGDAFRSGRAADFNSAAADYLAQLQPQFGAVSAKARREQFFNNLSPFTNAMAIYVAVSLCAICFWFAPVSGEWLRRTAVLLCLLALVIHAGGLIFRMALEGRPPVTNLYSAAVFIGFAACVLGLVLETVWRNSIGIIVSSLIGFSTLLIAHHLALAGDTMEMMRAVLDTNFWLSTHVVIVTLGYASTYVAGFLGIVFVVRGTFTTSLDAALRKSLAKMIYAITCFAALFSFVGTVLGGIWADQSWGRFWGWDPKENGALIIVLWNVLILHARSGGMARERGLANLAIFGNIVTAWSFFGTNMLGVGLHSYGFMDEERVALIAFVASQLALIALGSVPVRFWQSFKSERGPVGPVRKPLPA
jgi:ABC-type transport system involved in cytochrome c biogenesis permease subunit/LEA14-like dessication related protein